MFMSLLASSGRPFAVPKQNTCNLLHCNSVTEYKLITSLNALQIEVYHFQQIKPLMPDVTTR
eukprot:m.341343 g.341343  ORF g.341343 m.341343 type:complete len:62 (+) comp20039_c0_seq1:1636-1821(+)